MLYADGNSLGDSIEEPLFDPGNLGVTLSGF